MDTREAIELVKRYKELVSQYLPIKSVYLFGSYSKGGFTEESDVDVAVIISREKEKTWLEDSRLLWRLTWNIDTIIEPILIYEGSATPLYHDVLKTGIEI